LIWTTFDVKIYIEHIQLLDYPYDVRHELQTYFLVVETFLIVLAFGVVLPFVNVLRLPIPYKWFNTNSTTSMITINEKID
jgi:hypothetical protein